MRQTLPTPRVRPWIVLMGLWMLFATATAFGQMNPTTVQAEPRHDVVPQGGTSAVVIELQVREPFHIQSAKPHDEFLVPTKVKVTAPAGVQAGTPRFPLPEEVPTPAGASTFPTLSVYAGKSYIQVPFTVAADAPTGEASIELAVTTQACDDKSCLPPSTKKLKVAVKIAPAGTPAVAHSSVMFAAADKQVYAQAAEESATRPVEKATTQPATTTAASTADVKLMSDEEQVKAIEARPYAPFNAAEHEYSIPTIVLFALVGGLILNIMPCVLPVIPLKALSLVQQAHGDRKLAVMHGLVFSAGVVSLFVALAIVLRTFGWFYGQQFQSATFLIVMVYFVVALALSMIGVWTINPPTAVYAADATLGSHSGYVGSFSNGLMATLLATPCSAPYLGPVLAWALTRPTWLAVMALGLVGVGMSLPYLVLAAFPQLLNRMPRAGRWSELLKQGLGIVMLGVAVYLLFLVPNANLWPWITYGAVVVGMVCWGWGQIPTYAMSAGRIWGIRLGAVVAGIAIGVPLVMLANRVSSVSYAAQTDGKWQAFNVALLDRALAEGRPVVVDWTADWCINCRALEAAVLNREETQVAFRQADALLLRADLSTDNPPATALNRKLGGEAIPVLAIFSPKRKYEPVVLRDVYGVERVVGEVGKAR